MKLAAKSAKISKKGPEAARAVFVLFAFFRSYMAPLFPRPYSQKRCRRSNVHAIASAPIA